MYNIAAGTVDAVEYLINFFGLLACKSSCFFFLFLVVLQQSDLKFVRHGEHLSGFSFCICLFFDFVTSYDLLEVFISPRSC